MDPRMMNQWLAAQGQKKQITEADIQRKRLGIINEGGKATQDEEFVGGGGGSLTAPQVGEMGVSGRRAQAGFEGGRANIYNPRVNAQDAAVEAQSKQITRGRLPYEGEVDTTRIPSQGRPVKPGQISPGVQAAVQASTQLSGGRAPSSQYPEMGVNENFGSGVVPTAAARTAAGMNATAASLQDKNYYYVKPIRQKSGPVSKEMEQDLAFRQYAETAGPEYASRKEQHQEDLGRAKQETEQRSKLDQLKGKLNVPAKDLNNPYRV